MIIFNFSSIEFGYKHIYWPLSPPSPTCLSLSVGLPLRCVYIASRWVLPWQAASVALSLIAGHSNDLEAIPCLHCLFWSGQPSVYDCIRYSCVPLHHTHVHSKTPLLLNTGESVIRGGLHTLIKNKSITSSYFKILVQTMSNHAVLKKEQQQLIHETFFGVPMM